MRVCIRKETGYRPRGKKKRYSLFKAGAVPEGKLGDVKYTLGRGGRKAKSTKVRC